MDSRYVAQVRAADRPAHPHAPIHTREHQTVIGDRELMRRAIELAERGIGRVRPNPPVGAVLVGDGRILGEGFHARAGGRHAERIALDQAGDAARGATLYVTLEPCNHHGRTPPCTTAIIQSGVAEVVYARKDPNPGVEGHGHDYLAAAGIRVRGGILAEEAAHLTRAFEHAVRTGRPFVIAKFAASLDGRIATRTGESQWITGAAARRRAHGLRAKTDAILVGAGTVCADNPQLTVRLAGDDRPGPVRIVLDSTGRISANADILAPGSATATIVATTDRMPESRRRLLAQRGAVLWTLEQTPTGRVDLDDLLLQLGHRDIRSLLVEGGSTVLGAFIDGKLVDEVWAFLAPLVIGGTNAFPAIAGLGAAALPDAMRLDDVRLETVGDDILVRGRPIRKVLGNRREASIPESNSGDPRELNQLA